MMKVAMIALLAAPCALAFTVENLVGVWSCTVDFSLKNVGQQNVNPVATPGTRANPTNANAASWISKDQTTRVVVFDPPTGPAGSRKFTGRSYYDAINTVSNGMAREEHNFHGFMKTGDDGIFYIDENVWNDECNWYLTGDPTTGPPFTGQRTGGTGALLIDELTIGTSQSIADNKMYPAITAGAYIYQGSCQSRPEGPFEFIMEDVDHFSLTVDPTDLQLDNYVTGSSAIQRIHSVEKCMRGLPIKSAVCAELSRSKITTPQERDDACQGTLVCGDSTATSTAITGTPPAGTVTGVCEVPVRVQQQFQQFQYYPQPQYYQQPFQQFQQFQMQSPFSFFGR